MLKREKKVKSQCCQCSHSENASYESLLCVCPISRRNGSSFPSLSFFVSPPYLIEGIHAEGSKKLINWAENQSDKIRLERRNNGGLKSVLAVQFLFLKPTTKRCRSFLDFSSKAKCTVSCFLQRCLLCDCESSSFVMSFRLIHGILRIHGLCEWNAGICRHPSATHSC